MQFRIADTFTDSLARLTGDEQKAAKTTAFDLQMNPASPGLSFHKLDKAKDKNFWSVRVSGDIAASIASVSFRSNNVSTSNDRPSPTTRPALLYPQPPSGCRYAWQPSATS